MDDTASHAPSQNLLGGDAFSDSAPGILCTRVWHLQEHLQGLGACVSSAGYVQGSELVNCWRSPVSAWTRGARDLPRGSPGAQKVHGAQFTEVVC